MTVSAAAETANYSEKDLYTDPSSSCETDLSSGGVSRHETFLYHETFDFPEGEDFASDESGVGTIETVLILVVLISLVLIFQTQMRSIINNVFKTINSGVNEVKLK